VLFVRLQSALGEFDLLDPLSKMISPSFLS